MDREIRFWVSFGVGLLSLFGLLATSNEVAWAQGSGLSQQSQEVIGDCLAITFVDSLDPTNESMGLVTARAIDAGWAVRLVDPREEPYMVEKWRVHNLPTTVLVHSGREVDRILGPISWPELSRRMLRFSSADSIKAAQRITTTNVPRDSRLEALVPMQQRPSNMEIAQQATVRIVIDEPQFHAVGSGTIIRSDEQGAVVLTCGHLFRDWTKSSLITVERFEQGEALRYPAELIDYQFEDADIGVLVFRPGKVVPSVTVATAEERVSEGDSVFSIGCDHGDRPTRRDTRITKLNRYLGAPNIEAAGMPVQGRSGGGLFNSNGQLIGVCFAADSQLDEGLYSSTETVLRQLDRVGLRTTKPMGDSGSIPMQLADVGSQPPNVSTSRLASSMTVILTDTSGSTSQLTIDQPSRELLDAMQVESRRTKHANATSQVRWKVQNKVENR